MRRNRMRELSMEVLVGTFMFVALLGLCVFTIVLSRENVFRQTYPFEVIFADVMGLRDGDNVMMRGMVVGKVKAMTLHDEGVRVAAALQRPIHLKRDYAIDIVFSSVLGGRYMQISEGSPVLEPLAPGTVIRGQAPKDIMALVAAVAADLKDITGKINAGQGSIGKMLNDETLYNDARASMANLNAITDKINRGEGTLGLLVNDESLYLEVKQMIGDIRATVDEMRETSPIVTFSSIFFGAF